MTPLKSSQKPRLHRYELTTCVCLFFFQAEDGIRDVAVTGVQTCALPICLAGLLPIDDGTIYWNDRAIPGYSRSHTVFYVEDAIRPHALLSLASTLGFYGSEIGRASCRERV